MRVPFLLSGIISCAAVCCSGANLRPPLTLGFEARGGSYVAAGPGYLLTVSPASALLQARGQRIVMRLEGETASQELDPLDRMPGNVNYLTAKERHS